MNGLRDCKLYDANNKHNKVWKTTGPQYVTRNLIASGYDMESVLPYHIVNFGIDYAKQFGKTDFKITEPMGIIQSNKDLQYAPNLDEIMGVQLWMGGKAVKYNGVNKCTVETVKSNYVKYSAYIKKCLRK